MHNFFLNSDFFDETNVTIRDRKIAHQIKNVLRMEEGELFMALDNSGLEFLCMIKNMGQNEVEAKILERRNNDSEPRFEVIVYQALPQKMALFEMVVQKGTEIGASAFVPLITDRTERKNFSKPDRIFNIAKEAAEQSKRGKIPRILPPAHFRDSITEESVILHCDGMFPVFSSAVPEIKNRSGCNIFIGPEGGFSPEEIALSQEKKAKIFSLGPRILRTETAAISALSLLLL